MSLLKDNVFYIRSKPQASCNPPSIEQVVREALCCSLVCGLGKSFFNFSGLLDNSLPMAKKAFICIFFVTTHWFLS